MANETKYGVISDVHQNPGVVPVAIDVLKRLGAQKLLVNGDIGNHQRNLEESQNYIAFILDAIGKSGLESFVQPGSHETIGAYAPVIDYFTNKYPNIVDVLKTPKSEQTGHDLVFLPGSDFLCGGEYSLNGQEDLPTDSYIRTGKGLVSASFDQYMALRFGPSMGLDKSFYPISGFFHNTNMNDLKKLVSAPEKTIVVCHVPRRFANLETCVDVAEFGEAEKNFDLQGRSVEQGSVFPLPIAKQIVQAGYPVKIKKENSGNADLAKLYRELGITKAISGHFHESGHRANDNNGNHVPEGQLVKELYWNSGYLDAGQTGILTTDGENVSYQNVCLQDYLK